MCPVKVSYVLGKGDNYVVFLAHVNGTKCAVSVEEGSQTYNDHFHLYARINKMPEDDSVFLAKADCYVAVNREYILSLLIPVNGLNVEKELPNSRSGKHYGLILTEYKGKTTLAHFMERKSRVPRRLIYSFALQIAKIILLLADKGYSHNNLNPHNIVINKTDSKFFTLNGTSINYHSYQLSAINYQMLLYKDHKKDPLPLSFVNDRKKWIFDELRAACFPLFIGRDRTAATGSDRSTSVDLLAEIGRLPSGRRWKVYQRACRKMFRKEPRYCLEKIQRFLKVFPNAKPMYASIDDMDAEMSSSKLSRALSLLLTDTCPPAPFWDVITRVIELYVLDFPSGSQDFGWCCPAKALIPRDLLEELQTVKTTRAYINAILERAG